MKVVVFLLQFCLHDFTCKKKRIMTKNDRTGPLKNIALAYNLIKKETLAQVFSCEFCEIFKNTFIHKTPPVAAFVSYCTAIHNMLLFKACILGMEGFA